MIPGHEQVRKGSQHVYLAVILDDAALPELLKAELWHHSLHLRENLCQFALLLGGRLLGSEKPSCLPPINPTLACIHSSILAEPGQVLLDIPSRTRLFYMLFHDTQPLPAIRIIWTDMLRIIIMGLICKSAT